MDIESIRSSYRRYARIYDLVFGRIFQPGRQVIIDDIDCRPGDRVLEVGVGTGISLPMYRDDVRVTGIDLSREMLDQARERVAREGLHNIDAIEEMDAEAMSYADGSFDKVVAMYVVSVSPNPVQLVDEMRRVCRPGGDIFVVNHFRSTNPLLALMERLLAPLSKLAGFRPDLDLREFLDRTGLDVVEIRRANLFGYWKVIHCRNEAPSEAGDDLSIGTEPATGPTT